MRKLLIALALVPAISQAALVIEGGTPIAATPGVPVVQPSTPVAAAPAPVAQSTGFVVAPLWEATPADENFAKLFARWAGKAGWKTFWEVGQDIPVVASSPFPGSFTDAVQDVLDTTLSTDLPVHPCFYSNNVLRVLPTSTECDPR